MNQLDASAQSAPEPSPVKTSTVRAPYIAPQLEIHDSWVLTTGVSLPLEGLLHQLPGRSS